MEDNYELFKKDVFLLTKIDLNAYKERQMKRRIDALIAKHKISTYSEYVKVLKEDKERFDEFVKRIAEFYNDVNYIHPFREGNGRTQRIYFTQLIRHYGYDINFADVDTDELMIATVQASSGVMDFLVDFFENSIIIFVYIF